MSNNCFQLGPFALEIVSSCEQCSPRSISIGSVFLSLSLSGVGVDRFHIDTIRLEFFSGKFSIQTRNGAKVCYLRYRISMLNLLKVRLWLLKFFLLIILNLLQICTYLMVLVFLDLLKINKLCDHLFSLIVLTNNL